MIRWTLAEIEQLLGGKFDPVSLEDLHDFHQLDVEVAGIFYNLNISPATEMVWLRADARNPNQATPHFEFYFRCDRIRTGEGGYGSRAIFFEFSDGEENIDFQNHCRLVMDLLPNGNLYVWPVLGSADQPLEPGTAIEGKSVNPTADRL